MSHQTSINTNQLTLDATSFQGRDEFNQLRAFLSQYTDLEVMRHWSSNPLPGAPAILEDAVGIFPDLEWFDNTLMPNVASKITEIGLAVCPMTALRQCNSPTEFSTVIEQSSVFHIRILDNCHMRNKSRGFEDAEKNSLYCGTRFLAEDEAQRIFVNFLNSQKTKDGRNAPVLLIGHGWNKDEEQLRKHWKLNVTKLDCVVYKVLTLARPVQAAGIIPVLDREWSGRFFSKVSLNTKSLSKKNRYLKQEA
ncbi:Nn.00g117500.m01.CDS01 [Neocucurbitaria sp. VM-36]